MNSARVRSIIANVLKIEPGAVRAGLEFESLPDWDSMRQMTVAMELESALGIEFDFDETERLKSVDAVLSALAARQVEMDESVFGT